MGKIPLLELKVQNDHSMFFFDVLIPYSRLSRIDQTNIDGLPAHIFFIFPDVQDLYFPETKNPRSRFLSVLNSIQVIWCFLNQE